MAKLYAPLIIEYMGTTWIVSNVEMQVQRWSDASLHDSTSILNNTQVELKLTCFAPLKEIKFTPDEQKAIEQQKPIRRKFNLENEDHDKTENS